MYIVAKTKKEHAFLYSSKYSILCKNQEQAKKLSNHLNENNNNNIGNWKLKDDEMYFVYEIDKYDRQPLYRLKSTKNKISLVYNY